MSVSLITVKIFFDRRYTISGIKILWEGREKYSAGISGMDLRMSPDVGGGFRSVRVSTGERQSRTRFKGAASRPGAGVEGLR